MNQSNTRCKNCEAPLPEGAAYCLACGQSVKEFSRPWTEFAREAVSELFDFDGRMLSSFRLLMSRPGFLSLEYFRGRRLAHTSPLRMYLVISLLFFLVLPLIIEQVITTYPEHEVPVDVYSKAMFLLMPVFALILKLLYRKVFYLSHLVFSVHLFSAMFVVLALMLSIEALADQYLVVMLAQLLLLAYMVAYCIIALHTAYQEGWGKSTWKFLVLWIFFLPVLVLIFEIPAHRAS